MNPNAIAFMLCCSSTGFAITNDIRGAALGLAVSSAMSFLASFYRG